MKKDQLNLGLKFQNIEEKFLQEIISDFNIELNLLINDYLIEIVNKYNTGFKDFSEIKKTKDYILNQTAIIVKD